MFFLRYAYSSDSAKAKHIFKFDNSFVKEERRILFSPAASSGNLPGLTASRRD